VLKQGLSKTKTGRPRSESRRRAATPLPRPRAAHPCPSASSPMRRLRPPAVPGRAASLGRHAPRDARSPRRDAPARHPRSTSRTRAARPSGPSAASPPSCAVLRPEPSHRHHRRSGRPYLRHPPFLLASPEPAPTAPPRPPWPPPSKLPPCSPSLPPHV
jgi:hypothetical protein